MKLEDIEIFFNSIPEANPVTINRCEYISDPITTAEALIYLLKFRSGKKGYLAYYKKLVKIYNSVKKNQFDSSN